MMTDAQLLREWDAVRAMRIYFGHQSVGRNVIQGLRDIAEASQLPPLTIIPPENAVGAKEAFFAESNIGKNGQPEAKCKAFYDLLNDARFGDSLDVALLKFCFVDIKAESNPNEVFSFYKATINRIRQKYPRLAIVHVTLPLTTRTTTWRRIIKTLLGRSDTSDPANAKRNEFNAALINEYGTACVFDLARLESTREDGTRQMFEYQGVPAYSLMMALTDDGGHLNQKGRVVAARELMRVLADVVVRSGLRHSPSG